MSQLLFFAYGNLALVAFFLFFWWKTKDGLALALACWGFMLSIGIMILEIIYA